MTPNLYKCNAVKIVSGINPDCSVAKYREPKQPYIMKKLTLKNSSYRIFISNFKEWLDILGYAESTVYQLPIHLQEFFYYIEQQGIEHLTHITSQTIKDYYNQLQQRANERQGGGLSKSYLNKHQQALKKFKEYLQKHNYKGFRVHLQHEGDALEERINILTQPEIKQLFKATDYSNKRTCIRLRDKALLVILYSCGLRRNEAVHLNINDILFDKERIYVRKGKNYKERVVPINRKNAEILEDYLYESRPEYHDSHLSDAFLVNQHGKRLGGTSLANRLKAIVKATHNPEIIDKDPTPHTLRHSIATHLLEQGVALENIKTFLGHSSLESTQLYVHLLKHITDETIY